MIITFLQFAVQEPWTILQPDLDGQGVHKGEQPGGFAARDLVQDANAQVHERLGEVDYVLAGKVDGHGTDSQVSLIVQ